MTSFEQQSQDEWGLSLARAVAGRADCSRRQVGAVIIGGSDRVISVGYNAAPTFNQQRCLDGGCPRAQSSVAPDSSYDTGPGACIALHAEQRAIIQASWIEMDAAAMYVTDDPCPGCMKMIMGAPLSYLVTPSGSLDIWPVL